jgi:hypothetical protein
MLAALAYYLATGWWKSQRSAANQGECGQPPTLKRGPYRHWDEANADYFDAALQWCDAHEEWFGPDECPGCKEDWDQTWTLGEEPDGDEERYRDKELSDGWYLDMLARADFRHDGWRDR